MIKTLLGCFTILAFSLLSTLPVEAAGLEISPAKIELTANLDKSAEAAITVANPTADVQIFEVYPDDFVDQFKISPSSFTLEAGGRKSVAVSFNPSKNNQKLSTTISVVARPLAESRFEANSGVKVPITITIEKTAMSPLLKIIIAGAAVLFIILLAIILYRNYKMIMVAIRP